MSEFRYNGVTLHYVKTLRFGITDEKDPSGADQLWRVYDIQVRGVVSNGSTVTNGPQSLNALRETLTTPRKGLYYKMGSEEMFNTSGVDSRYGPDAPTAEVTEVVEGVIFATVSVRLRVACQNGGSDIVSLRWSQTEEIDGSEWLTSVVTRGLLIVRTDLRLLSADSFREAIPIPLPYANFARRYSFTLSEDGTRLMFELRDTEKYRMPPNLAVEASGTFAVTAPKPGAIRYAAVNLTLKGPPNIDRGLLMAQAFGVAWAKLKTARLATATQDGDGRVIVGYTAVEDMYRNVVQVSMQATMAVVDMDLLGEANQKLYGSTPGSEGIVRSIAPPARRQITGLLAAAFRDPCLSATTQNRTLSSAGGDSIGVEGNSRILVSDSVPFSLSSGSTPAYERDRGGYDWYKVSITYDHDEGKRGMPGSGVGPTPKRAKVVTVHGGMMVMIVDWAVKRRGKPPVLPSYQINDANLTPLRAIYRPDQNDPNADQNQTWDVAGRFVYQVLDPDQVAILSARPPYLSEKAAQATTQSTQYSLDSVISTWLSQSGGGAVGGGGFTGGDSPVSGGGGQASPNPITGSGIEKTEPDPKLSRELTDTEKHYVDLLTQLGADRQSVENDLRNGIIPPVPPVPGVPPVNP